MLGRVRTSGQQPTSVFASLTMSGRMSPRCVRAAVGAPAPHAPARGPRSGPLVITKRSIRQSRARITPGYRTNVVRHLAPLIGTKKIARLTARDVRLLLEECPRAGLSEHSTRYVHATLRAAL